MMCLFLQPYSLRYKVKFTPEQALEAQKGSRGTALLFPYPQL